MKPITAHLVYFSPTGTTCKVLRCIAAGIGVEDTKEVNLTLPHSRQGLNGSLTTDLLLLGVPVYEENIPPVILPFLETITGHGQNAIVVALYGNVGNGLVLQDLEKLLTSKGFNVIAGAAFIGEHSYSHTEFPIAQNRPDETDKEIAIDFGRKIAEKLSSHSTTSRIFPGHLPLIFRILPEGSAANFAHPPGFEAALCTHCGLCGDILPYLKKGASIGS